MGKYKKAGYLFYTWKGDHLPRHVHVLKDGKLICKWDLSNGVVLEGKMNNRIRAAINSLIREGKL